MSRTRMTPPPQQLAMLAGNPSVLYAVPATKPDHLLNETELRAFLTVAEDDLARNSADYDAARAVVRFASLLGVVLRGGIYNAHMNYDAGVDFTKYAARIEIQYHLESAYGHSAIGWCYQNAFNSTTGQPLVAADSRLALTAYQTAHQLDPNCIFVLRLLGERLCEDSVKVIGSTQTTSMVPVFGHMTNQPSSSTHQNTAVDAAQFALGVSYLVAAANASYVPAIYDLAWEYELGRGISQDPKKAHDLFLQAAESGSANAKYQMGRIHETWHSAGHYGYYDLRAARQWYRAARDQGYTNNNIDQKIRELSPCCCTVM